MRDVRRHNAGMINSSPCSLLMSSYLLYPEKHMVLLYISYLSINLYSPRRARPGKEINWSVLHRTMSESQGSLESVYQMFFITINFWHIPEMSIFQRCPVSNFNQSLKLQFQGQRLARFFHKSLDRNTCFIQTQKFYFLHPFSSSIAPGKR